jgi:2,4-dienoyl-CoA reductase-like NADH-dependent reductase (Old Yellow Enzyme family)
MPDRRERSLGDPVTFRRGPALQNRLFCSPMTTCQSHADGGMSDEELRWLGMRADGGFGLTMTSAAQVQEIGRGFPRQMAACSDVHLSGLAQLASVLRQAGTVSSLQLYHAGKRAVTSSGLSPVAPYADDEHRARALETGEVYRIVDDFVAAAVRAEKAGFDGVEIHGAHDYLLAQFFDGSRNHRADEFGGSFENRTRIHRLIIEGIRRSTRDDFQLGLRLSPDRRPGTLAETRLFAEQMMLSGEIDYLDMSLWNCFKMPEEDGFRHRPLVEWFAELPRGDCRLAVAGKINSAAIAYQCLELGVDFVAIGKSAILHHDFARSVIADPAFASVPLPVTRSYLATQGVGTAFADYLSTMWKSGLA